MKILMPYWRRIGIERGFYQHFSDHLCDAARELGHSMSRFEFSTPGRVLPAESDRLLRQFLFEEFDFVLDISCKGAMHLSERVWDGSEAGESMLDSVEMPYVGILLDQVYLQALLAFVRAERLYLALPDSYHDEQLTLTYPEIKLVGAVLAPPAVTQGDDRSTAAWADRDIDLLYVGNINLDALRRGWRGEPDTTILDAVADQALSDPAKPLHHCYQEVVGTLGLRHTPALALYVLRRVEGLLRARFRHDAVLAAAKSGARFCVVGSGWNKMELPSNVSWLASVDYDQVLALYGRAKVCLEASTYLGGASDRAFGIAVNGAMCLTNADRYLSKTYGMDGGIAFYSMRQLDSLSERVRALLSRGDDTARRASDAREVTLAHHTWCNRLGSIVKLVSGIS
jgi:hypothetical protein